MNKAGAGLNLNYRWQQLFELSQEHGLIHQYTKPRIQVTAFSYRKLAGFWLEQIKKDPLFLLNTKSRESIEPLLEKLGRRFEITDFEISQPQNKQE